MLQTKHQLNTFVQPRTAKVITSVRETLPGHLWLSSPELELAIHPSRDRAVAVPDTQTHLAAASRWCSGSGLSHNRPQRWRNHAGDRPQLGRAEQDKEQPWSCPQVLPAGRHGPVTDLNPRTGWSLGHSAP